MKTATELAQQIADQELEACCEWIHGETSDECFVTILRAARRPKPPSLKEEALADLDIMTTVPPGMSPLSFELTERISRIRRALKSIPDPS